MSKYRKRPIVIEAIQYDGFHTGELHEFCEGTFYEPVNGNPFIETLEGNMEVSKGDYIIKGVNGEFYPCKPDIFFKTYEPVLENAEKETKPVILTTKRTTENEVPLEGFSTQYVEIGDVIGFTLNDGEEVEAMAVRREDDGMVFLFVDCLKDEYPMNEKNSNKGGYLKSDLRSKLNSEILDRFPTDLRERMIPFANEDLLRLPTEKEIFGENPYGKDEPDVEQFKPMKERRNRIAFQGKNGAWEWYWLQNTVKGSSAYFAGVAYDGFAAYYSASFSRGVRPAFKI